MPDIYQDCENMILYHANRFRNYYDIEDLIQVGRIGLEKAKKNYNGKYNTKFSTFAYVYIKGEILKYVKNDRLIKYGQNYEKINIVIEKAREFLRHQLMREPTTDEISTFTEIELSIIEEAILSRELIRSLDYVMNEEDDGKEICLYDSVAYLEKGYREEILDLKEAIGELTETERKIIEYRYYQDMTQQETSEILGINQVKVSRTEGKILQKLKRQLEPS